MKIASTFNQCMRQKTILLALLVPLSACDLAHHIEKKAEAINRFEVTALHLAKENDVLKARVGQLEAEVETLRTQNGFLTLKLSDQGGKSDRAPASVAPVSAGNDLVKFQTYKWKPAQLTAMAQKEFELKNYEKSAQFFQTLLEAYPGHQQLDDRVLFQAGVAAYESGKHDDWVIKNMDTLITKHPTSDYYRGAKLWRSLAQLRMGKDQEFFKTVDEFRKKYRNTTEWDIISAHYEKMLQKYKK